MQAACLELQHQVQLGVDLAQDLIQQVSLGKAVVDRRYMFIISCFTFIEFLQVDL